MKIAEKVKEFFHNEGIHSTTIQPEFSEIEGCNMSDGTSSINMSGSDCCALDCPTTDEGCVKATCCQNNNKLVQKMGVVNYVPILTLSLFYRISYLRQQIRRICAASEMRHVKLVMWRRVRCSSLLLHPMPIKR